MSEQKELPVNIATERNDLMKADFYCPSCSYACLTVFVDIEPFETSECDKCGMVMLREFLEPLLGGDDELS